MIKTPKNNLPKVSKMNRINWFIKIYSNLKFQDKIPITPLAPNKAYKVHSNSKKNYLYLKMKKINNKKIIPSNFPLYKLAQKNPAPMTNQPEKYQNYLTKFWMLLFCKMIFISICQIGAL